MATPTYKISSVSSSGKINLMINAGNNYKNYYFEVYIRYDEADERYDKTPFLETGPKKYGTSRINLSYTKSQLANGGQFVINIGMRETEDGVETYLGKKQFSTALLEYYNESKFFTDDFYVSLTSLKPTIQITELAPTRSGYVFNKWRVQSGSTSQVGSSFYSGSTGGWLGGYYKLKAEWLKINSLTLNYNANGGVFSNGKTTYQDYQESETATSFSIVIYSAPTREGYNFLNWKVTSGPDKVNNTYSPGARGTWAANDTPYTLTAQWEEIPCYKINITYATNGGKWADGTTAAITKTYINYNSDQVSIKLLDAPATPPEGKIFYYWRVTAGPDKYGEQYPKNGVGTWTGSLTGKNYTLTATWTTPSEGGVVYVNGKVCIPYIYTGNSWKECEAWIYANGKWNLCIE